MKNSVLFLLIYVLIYTFSASTFAGWPPSFGDEEPSAKPVSSSDKQLESQFFITSLFPYNIHLYVSDLFTVPYLLNEVTTSGNPDLLFINLKSGTSKIQGLKINLDLTIKFDDLELARVAQAWFQKLRVQGRRKIYLYTTDEKAFDTAGTVDSIIDDSINNFMVINAKKLMMALDSTPGHTHQSLESVIADFNQTGEIPPQNIGSPSGPTVMNPEDLEFLQKLSAEERIGMCDRLLKYFPKPK